MGGGGKASEEERVFLHLWPTGSAGGRAEAQAGLERRCWTKGRRAREKRISCSCHPRGRRRLPRSWGPTQGTRTGRRHTGANGKDHRPGALSGGLSGFGTGDPAAGTPPRAAVGRRTGGLWALFLGLGPLGVAHKVGRLRVGGRAGGPNPGAAARGHSGPRFGPEFDRQDPVGSVNHGSEAEAWFPRLSGRGRRDFSLLFRVKRHPCRPLFSPLGLMYPCRGDKTACCPF